MVPFVRSDQVVHVNGEDFAWPSNPNGAPNGMDIPTGGTQVIGPYWRVPQMQGPRVIGWQYLNADNSTTKPQPDALKVLSLKTTGEGAVSNIIIAIADTDEYPGTTPASQYAFLSNGLGGALPVMPTVTIPVPIMQQDPQSTDSSGTNTFIFAFPVNNATPLEYQVNGMWLNGISITPSMAGLTTVTAVATAFNTAYSAYGTWSATGNILKLVSPTSATTPVTKAGIDVELKPTAYCFDLTAYSTPAMVDGVKFGASATIPLTPFMLTDDPGILRDVLKAKMSVGTVFSTAVANKLGILTVQELPTLYAGAVVVEASTAGTC